MVLTRLSKSRRYADESSYIHDTLSGTGAFVRRIRASEFAHTISKALGLPKTAAMIIGALARARESLGVEDLVRRVKSSERSVRENLQLLLRRGILARKVFVTANKKLAYAYTLRPVEDLIAAARRDVAHTIARIEAVARRFRETSA